MGRSNNKMLKVGFALLLIVVAFPAYDFLRYDIFTREFAVKCEVERVYDRKIKGDGFPRSVLPHCEFSFDKLFCKTSETAVYRFVNNSGKLEVYEEAANPKFQLAVIQPYSLRRKDEDLRNIWAGKGRFLGGEISYFGYNSLSNLIYYRADTKDFDLTTNGKCSRISPAPDIPLLLNNFFLNDD